MDRLQEKNELLIKLGALFGPLQRVAECPEAYDEQEQAEVIARYCAEYPKIIQEFQVFCRGQPGHNYEVQWYKFHGALWGTFGQIKAGKKNLAEILSEEVPLAREAISAVPIPRDSTILDANTPFSTYCKLKDLVEGDATTALVWVDAYMACNIFHRFLRGVKPQASITLVTSKPKPGAHARDSRRWEAFLDVSRLFAEEVQPNRYRLIVHEGLLHDRWLLLDGKRLYSLGGSAKDAGDKCYFTLARIESSTANVEKIQRHIDSGKEYFGNSTPEHL